jgi:hypothetical protein
MEARNFIFATMKKRLSVVLFLSYLVPAARNPIPVSDQEIAEIGAY